MKPRSSLLSSAIITSILILSSISNPCLSESAERSTAKSAKVANSTPTAKNLMIAYSGQTNAKEKFLAYAKKADEEGYLEAGRLFRAAANSAEIHARNTAKILTNIGITPAATVRKHDIKTTKENLLAAVKSEGYKSERLYAKFVKQAKNDNVQAAIIAFGSSVKVDGKRKILFENALKNLENYKTATKGFFVCQICGNVVEVIDFTDCPVCGYPSSEYKKIK